MSNEKIAKYLDDLRAFEKEQQLFEPEIMESMNKANKAEESLFGTE
jgi:hypothetical protein